MFFFRNYRTSNERRQTEGHLRDGIKVRAKRQPQNIMHLYIDYGKPKPERSWKSHRKTQYRPAA